MNTEIVTLQKRQSCLSTFRSRCIRTCEKEGVAVLDERIRRVEGILNEIGNRLRLAYNKQYIKKPIACVQ